MSLKSREEVLNSRYREEYNQIRRNWDENSKFGQIRTSCMTGSRSNFIPCKFKPPEALNHAQHTLFQVRTMITTRW